MSSYGVPQPILICPYEEPARHRYIAEGEPALERRGRRPTSYFYQEAPTRTGQREARGVCRKPLCARCRNTDVRDRLIDLRLQTGEADRIAVKVIDDRGNGLMVVKSLQEAQG